MIFPDEVGRKPINLFADVNIGERTQKAKSLQQPQHHANHNDGIEDTFNGTVHWNIVVDEPKEHANNNQYDKHTDERHLAFLFPCAMWKMFFHSDTTVLPNGDGREKFPNKGGA
jgi:hypothetical protein